MYNKLIFCLVFSNIIYLKNIIHSIHIQLVILTISVIDFFIIVIAGIKELKTATKILINKISKKLKTGNVNLIGNYVNNALYIVIVNPTTVPRKQLWKFKIN